MFGFFSERMIENTLKLENINNWNMTRITVLILTSPLLKKKFQFEPYIYVTHKILTLIA